MASRMDRYSKTEIPTGRSDRNKSLYKQIEDLDTYTNIAGIATMENKNEIDIEKVKAMLKSRESKINEKYIKEQEEQQQEEILEDETRNYDIKDLLSKVKENKDNDEKKYRSLSEKQYKILQALNERNKINNEISNLDIHELTKTDMSDIDDNTDDVGLLDDLKSDTMVGDASSIKKIIDEEKEFTKEFDTMQLDKSFYTSSFGFTQKDFEELKDMNHKIKKGNKFIITLLIILILLIIAGVIFFVVR